MRPEDQPLIVSDEDWARLSMGERLAILSRRYNEMPQEVKDYDPDPKREGFQRLLRILGSLPRR